MILSFSIPAMRPMIEAGLAQMAGANVGAARVKRQTIRRAGPRTRKLLKFDKAGHATPYDWELWWKSRQPERVLIGRVPREHMRIAPIVITHATAESFADILRADGFDSVAAFRAWFVPKPDDVFEGALFTW